MHSCKLIIEDEVNIKLLGLPIEIRRKLVNAFKYEDPTARYRPSFKLGRWDGAITLFGIGGSGYLSQLPKIMEILEKANTEITEVEDKREPINLNFTEVAEDFWGEKTWPVGHIRAGEKIVLRDYQVAAVNAFLKNPQSIAQISTGSGKTLLTATLVKICEPYGRTITIVPSKSLVEQTFADFKNVGLDVGVYYGDKKDLNKQHTICTWQSLYILDKKSKDVDNETMLTLAAFLEGVTAVIIDETHAAKANSLQSLLTRNFRFTPIRWGLTGTVPKEDYQSQMIFTCIGPVINNIFAHELQAQGVLSTCHVNCLQLLDVKEFKTYPEELKYLVTNKERVEFLAQTINGIALNGNTLVLVDRIETGKMLVELLTSLTGNEIMFVSGEVKTKDRKSEYDEVKTDNNRIIVATYGVAAVGIDILRLFNLVLIEPGKSFVRVIQSIGRGIRKGGDKDDVQIWDISSTCKFSKKHLTTRKMFYRESKYPFTVKKVDWS